jgi:DNA-binding ferritin-like protein
MNLLYHQYHHVVARSPFFSDHEAFSSFYSTLDGNYDSVAERLIGLSDSSQLNLHAIMEAVSQKCKAYPQDAKENAMLFQAALQCEAELKQQIEALIKSGSLSQGTINLLAGIEDESEGRVYKIKARLKK